jgi:hypothetical protein
LSSQSAFGASEVSFAEVPDLGGPGKAVVRGSPAKRKDIASAIAGRKKDPRRTM